MCPSKLDSRRRDELEQVFLVTGEAFKDPLLHKMASRQVLIDGIKSALQHDRDFLKLYQRLGRATFGNRMALLLERDAFVDRRAAQKLLPNIVFRPFLGASSCYVRKPD